MNRHVARSLAAIILCLCVFNVSSQEATVYMKNGKELPPGKVLLIENSVLVYKSEYGDLSIPVDQVAQVVFSSGTKDREGIVLSTGDWIGGTIQSYRDGIWQIKTEFGQVVVTKSQAVTSVNFLQPKVLALKGLGKKGVTYRYVIDWLYSNELISGQNQSEWALKIEKITLINNQIIVTCALKNSYRREYLRPRFRMDDEFGNQYSPLKSSFSDGEYSFLEWTRGQIVFPNLKEGSKAIVLNFSQANLNPYNAQEIGIKETISTPKLELADLLLY